MKMPLKKTIFCLVVLAASMFGDSWKRVTFSDRATFVDYFAGLNASFLSINFNSSNSTGGTFGATLDQGVSISNVLYIDPATGMSSGGQWQIIGGTTWVDNMKYTETFNLRVANKVVVGMIADFNLPTVTSGLHIYGSQLAPGELPDVPVDSFNGTFGTAFFPAPVDGPIDPQYINTNGFDISIDTLSGDIFNPPAQYFQMSNITVALIDPPPPDPSQVPEPSSWALIGVGLASVGVWRRKRRQL